MARHRHGRRGLTIIELLVVLVVVGVLAGLATVQWRASRGRTYDAVLQADLHNLATAQEAHAQGAGAYAADLAPLEFTPSAGVTVTITAAHATGWGAVATHPQARWARCALFTGTVAPPAATDGVIACE